jgi:hypothetical protein
MTYAVGEAEDGSGYALELSIPLTSLPQTIIPGSLIGMEFQINDDDDGGAGDGTIKMYQSGSSWRNPSLLASAVFTDQLPPAVQFEVSSGPMWGPYEIDENGNVDTGAWLGQLNVEFAPFVYSHNVNAWLYVTEPAVEGSNWVYIYN